MDPTTAALYEAHADEWVARRRPRAIEDGRLDAFAGRLRPGVRVAELGCGPGWYAGHLHALGFRVVALDLAAAMLSEAARRAPHVARVRADLAALPFADRSFDAAWASAAYQHVPRPELPLALARLHLALRPGALVELTLANLRDATPTSDELASGEGERRSDRDIMQGRLFCYHTEERMRALVEGAGFEDIDIKPVTGTFWLAVRARRARSLPDLVGPGLRLLTCGLNPSLYAADVGIPFGRPGNRFWPAMRIAGLVAGERDPLDAFRQGVGMTDVVKRATASAHELRADECAAGLTRVEALVRHYQPGATCFVGLEAWRQVVDRRAQPGWVDGGFGGRPAYLMPSTSGRNAHARLDDLVTHLRRVARGESAQ